MQYGESLDIIGKKGDVKMNKYVVIIIFFSTMLAYSSTPSERINALRDIFLYIPSDDLTVNEVIPEPSDIKEKFGIDNRQLAEDIKNLSMKYTTAETNRENRLCRMASIASLGEYGSTNDLIYLQSVMKNSSDYARESALEASIYLLRMTPELIPFANEVVTNAVVYTTSLKRRVYLDLHYMSYKGNSLPNSYYVAETNVQKRIASFFLQRAALETDLTLYVDQVACELNPSYRHSQQRRDNLARLRPVGLTGEEADIYNYRQRDAERVADDK